MRGFVRVTKCGKERSTCKARRRTPTAKAQLLESLDEQIGAILLLGRGDLAQSEAGREIIALFPAMLCNSDHTDLQLRPLLPRLEILARALPVEAATAIAEMRRLLPPGKKAKRRDERAAGRSGR
jgi:hypothetical protein